MYVTIGDQSLSAFSLPTTCPQPWPPTMGSTPARRICLDPAEGSEDCKDLVTFVVNERVCYPIFVDLELD
jgi:hypothetical protein